MTEACPVCGQHMEYWSNFLWLCLMCGKYYTKKLIPDNSKLGYHKIWMTEIDKKP